MTPIYKLDSVLRILASKYPENHEFAFAEIKIDGMYLSELFYIIEKLEDDEYVKIRMTPETSEIEGLTTSYPMYSITFKGAFFILNEDGYQGQQNRLNAENIRVETLEISQQKLAKNLNLVTAWIAAGTIALVLIELWKIKLEYYPCH